jgi:hypothetical protein
MTTDHPEPDVVIVLRPQSGREPTAVRLRRLLKFALRTLGLKCISVEDVRRPTDGKQEKQSLA